MSNPGWHTDELGEEWVESGSPPPESPSEKRRSTSKPPTLSASTAKGSIANKRGSLRSLGYSAPRGLPSRNATNGSPERVVSGHGSGTRLQPSGDFLVPQGTGILSPPSSRSSSEGGPDIAAENGTVAVAGTCVVKDGVEDNRGGALARLGVKSKDIFGKNALERMFEPPSPPTASSDPPPASAPLEIKTPSRPPPTSTPSSGASSVEEVRRASHPFAPRNPSRLSKSMTPSSHSSSLAPSETSQLPADESALDDTLPAAEEDENSMSLLGPDGGPHDVEHSMQHLSIEGDEVDGSPLARGATRFPFTFNAPIRYSSGQTGSGTASGSATVRGGSIRQLPADDDFEALFNQPDNGDGPSHSTIHDIALPPDARGKRGALPPKSPKLPPNPNLRLFRSTYDTYTREHLSAIVDSIGIEASPSPPPPASAQYREWSPADSASPGGHEGSGRSGEGDADSWGTGTGTHSSEESTDSRSSKRLRLSPPSPKRQPRDWGNVGLEIMGRIKGRQVEESTTSASPYQSGGSLVDEEDGPSIEYPVIPPTPPLDRRAPSQQPSSHLAASALPRQTSHKPGPNGNHRSNPSTASSGYLRTAEAMMANLRQRAVSDSASAISGGAQTADSSAGDARKPLSETDENVGSSETDAWRSEWEYGGKSHRGGSMRGSRGKGRGASPRRLLRRLSAAEEMKRAGEDSAEEEEEERPPAQLRYGSVRSRQAVPRPALEAPSSPPGQGVNTDDLNRYVSSTTVPTTHTSTISTSFVKHAGPKGKGPMRVIRPDEVNGLVGQQVGKMRYDATLMRWVRERGGSGLERVSEGSAEESRRVGSEESVDVFAGMSEEGSRRGSAQQDPAPEHAGAEEEQSDTDTDSNAGAELANMTTIDAAALLDTSESEGEEEEPRAAGLAVPTTALTSSPLSLPTPLPAPTPARPAVSHTNSAPAILTPRPSSANPLPIRSALRNPNSNGQLSDGTPGLKKKASWLEDLPLTPFAEGSRSITRSVSFSDGKKHGKIEGLETGGVLPRGGLKRASTGPGVMSLSEQLRGLGEEVRAAKDKAGKKAMPALDDVSGPVVDEEMSGKDGGDGNLFDRNGMSLLASARTRRIQEVLGDMEELSLDNITPSKPSRWPEPVRPPALAPTPNPHAARSAFQPVPSGAADASRADTTHDLSTLPARSFRRSRSHRENAVATGQATFLTECSFAVASDQLVKVITDVQPFEPYWETLKEVDLNGKGLEGVGRLKEFLPALDEVNLNDNAISYLTGIPSGVRALQVAGNRLSSLTSVDHLRNLQVLDLSRNQLDSVSQLRCLKHLRDLRVDHNRITDLSSIMNMDSLVKLSARGNRIDKLDLSVSRWKKLEHLELPENGLGEVVGLEELEGLVTLNLDDNDLITLSSASPLVRLRTLKVCRNDLALLDMEHFPKVRTLYADENRLLGLKRSDRSRSRLDSLSLRSQRARGLRLAKGEMEGLKRLYISGNDLSPDFFSSGQLNQLTYLEMAACRLSAWPKSIAAQMSSLEVLNVNYNFLEDLAGLKGMRNLRKVSVVGNRLEGGDRGLKGLESLEEVDLRMNPSTLGYYISLFIPAHTAPASRPHLARPNKTAILLGRTGPNATLSASTRGSTTSMFFQQQETGADWAEMDTEFRRNLPDMWYGKRLAYRGGIMQRCPRLRVLDGLEVGEGERKKAAELLQRARRA